MVSFFPLPTAHCPLPTAMTRTSLLIIITALITAGWVAELSAQTPTTTDSLTRRGAMFGAGSRIAMFDFGGELAADRGTLKGKSLEQIDPKMTLLQFNDPATMLERSGTRNIDLFMTVGNAMQQAMGIAAPPPTADSAGGGVIAATIDTTNVDMTQTSAVVGRGMYAPRLRFWIDQAELEEMQKPEVVAEMKSADLERAAELVADINDKFGLPMTNITLEFDGLTAVVQGRVPNPTVRKQVEMYLGFEPGVYSVKNHLVVDPTMDTVDTPASGLPTTRNGQVAR